MKRTYSQYMEKLPDVFSIKHKITPRTEKRNFHMHRHLEIILALSGNLKCRFETATISIPENSLLFLNQMDLHYIFSEENSGMCDRYVLYFLPSYIIRFSLPEFNLLECFPAASQVRPASLPVPSGKLPQLIALLDQMDSYAALSGDDAPYGLNLQLQLLLGEFLLICCQLLHEAKGRPHMIPSAHTQLVYDIYEYIGKHYSEPLTADQIARQFLMGKTQLYAAFKEVSGMSIGEYITQYRLNKAKEFLLGSDNSIELISQAAGYGSLSAFSRAFKERTGLSPLSYRKKWSH